jgi:hypothetical protein
MKIERIRALQDQHSQLESEIAHLNTSPSVETWRIMALKRQKLHIKDQLAGALSLRQAFARRELQYA